MRCIRTLVQKKYCWIWSAVDGNEKKLLYWVQGELSQDKNSKASSKNAQQGVLREGFGQQIFEKAYQRRFINFNMMWRF